MGEDCRVTEAKREVDTYVAQCKCDRCRELANIDVSDQAVLYDGVIRLTTALMEVAFLDISMQPTEEDTPAARATILAGVEDAYRWFMSYDRQVFFENGDACIPFAVVCDCLGWDSSLTRAKALAHMHVPVSDLSADVPRPPPIVPPASAVVLVTAETQREMRLVTALAPLGLTQTAHACRAGANPVLVDKRTHHLKLLDRLLKGK